ncbi:MAG: twin-arginine translocase TatA/TatE family subunit [Bacteroidales bacterium]|jgi:sec-independent protein translocase protein TatA|nr:twin-arginine translocase TatA/TatE family subunit [Bacteroidales bacterium]MBR0123109.1 twin-arginine translocase TatA/TatE family subunit [Bacteroidales bacterium]MBR5651233.1 twin-arginine translocase TatA/TatE family subunit [Bacteroidales bacterium]
MVATCYECFIGGWEIALIVLVVLLLFGGKKIPELMKGLGKGVKSFKEGMNDDSNDDDSKAAEDNKK